MIIGFFPARVANNGNSLSRLYINGDVLQKLHLRTVRKEIFSARTLPSARASTTASGSVRLLCRCVHKIKNPPRAGQRIFQLCHHAGNLVEGLRILVCIIRKLVSCPTLMPPPITVKAPMIPTPVYTSPLTNRVAGLVMEERTGHGCRRCEAPRSRPQTAPLPAPRRKRPALPSGFPQASSTREVMTARFSDCSLKHAKRPSGNKACNKQRYRSQHNDKCGNFYTDGHHKPMVPKMVSTRQKLRKSHEKSIGKLAHIRHNAA